MSPISPLSAAPDRLSLEPNLDFVVRDGGVIELTKAGFRVWHRRIRRAWTR
jgi:hypothetical protein